MGTDSAETRRSQRECELAHTVRLDFLRLIQAIDWSVRYGDKPKLSTSNSMLPTYSIPSRLLQNCNLELIITSLPPSTGTDHVTEASLDPFEAVLVPKLEIPGSFAGQVSIIRLPVHAALVVADGIDGCLSLGRWMSTVPPSETKRWPIQIQVGLDLPAVGQAQENNATLENVAMLDSQKASEALNLFRKSNENATSYEKGWSGSGIQQVLDWIQLQSSDASVAMSPAVGRLIENILENAEAKLTRHVVALPQDDASELAGDSSTVGLNDAAAAWARRSHIELQGKLDAMRQGPVWAKTRWFKLLWRIDDVSLALQELLERNWLVNTEKELIWLAGRGLGEGILNEGVIGSTSFSQHLKDLEAVRKMSDEPTLSASEPSSEDPTSTKADAATDWFSLIPLTRARIAGETIPRMQRQAQVLVLQGLSLTGVSTALSALLYTSLPSFGIYEASTVAAFAVAWSLRQLQKKWEGSRSEWMSKLYEAGRQVLKRTELGIRASIHEGSRRPRNSSGGVVERQAARQALMEVQKALTVLKQETRA